MSEKPSDSDWYEELLSDVEGEAWPVQRAPADAAPDELPPGVVAAWAAEPPATDEGRSDRQSETAAAGADGVADGDGTGVGTSGSAPDVETTPPPELADGPRLRGVPLLSDIVSPVFVARHTPYSSLAAMLDASRLPAATPADLASTLSSGAWDTFVSQHTRFRSWSEMRYAAGRNWVARRLSGSD